MTFLELANTFGAEIDRIEPDWNYAPPDVDLIKQSLKVESEIRPAVDYWIRQRFLHYQDLPLTPQLKTWIATRLLWAHRWLIPLTSGPEKQHQIDYEKWVNWLLIELWPLCGVPQFVESLQSDEFEYYHSTLLDPSILPYFRKPFRN